MIYKKLKFFASPLLILLAFVSCATVSQIGTDSWRDYFKPGSSKDEITRDFNLYRGKWWNHYVRGRWYADGEFVNRPIINLKGVVSDDCYANSNNILIQGKKLFIELAEKNINFSEDVSLRPGENVICMEASDLTGKSVRKNITIIRDIRPPILYLDDVRIHQKNGKRIASVKGTVVDDYGLKELYINDTEVHIHSHKEDHFDEDIALTDGNKISFKVVDIAGNETRGKQQADTKASLWPGETQNDVKHVYHSTNKPILIAASKFDKSSIKSLLASQDVRVSQSSPQDSTAPGENNGEEEEPEQTG